MRTTIKSIAKDLGISHMTVSRALSGNENVNEETRKQIIDHAIRTGYVKSSAASAMRGEQTAIVGLLLPNIINEFYARFANALGSLCAEAGFDLVIHLTDDVFDQEEKSMRRLQALQARAVIRVPTPYPEERSDFSNTDMPTIDLIRTRKNEDSIGSLLIDDGLSIRNAVRHLANQNCRNIAYIGAPKTLSSGRQRLQAFTLALEEFKLKQNEDLICTGAPSYQMGYTCIERLIGRNSKPDALVCGGFEISNGALDACLSQAVKIPEELKFIGYGDPAFYRWIAGGISTISVPEHEVAKRALSIVQSPKLLDNEQNQIVPTRLIVRGT